MQLDSGRGGGTQHILEWGIFGLIFGGKAGVLLLKDGQSQHITGETDREEMGERKKEGETDKQGVSMDMKYKREGNRKFTMKIVVSLLSHFRVAQFEGFSVLVYGKRLK